jgi:hypothetical protein
VTGTNTAPLTLSDLERFIVGTDALELPATGQATAITGIVMLQIDSLVAGERHYWPPGDGLIQLGVVRTETRPGRARRGSARCRGHGRTSTLSRERPRLRKLRP